jgi:hypothetical protein
MQFRAASPLWGVVTFMGLEKRTTSFRMSPQTLSQLGEIQSSLAPITEDRSSTLRLIINFIYSIFFSPQTLQAVLERLQRLLRITSDCDSQMWLTFSEEPFPSPKQATLTKYEEKR